MRDRANESSLKIWLLLVANRLLVTMFLAGIVFAVFVLIGSINPAVAVLLGERSVIESIFGTMISALILGVTLVVAINQLIISQENGPLGDQHERMSNAMTVRGFVSELTGKPLPAEPAEFSRDIIIATESRAETVRRTIDATNEPELESAVEDFLDSVLENTEHVKQKLDGAEFGTFEVVSALLDYNYSWKIVQTEHLKHEYADVLNDDQLTALDELKQAFVIFGPVREHIKTLYFQWQLINLSRLILYTAVPGIVISTVTLAFVDSTTVTGQTMMVENLVWVIGAAFTLSLVPFLLLTVYILRIATVAKRTLAIDPLILRNV
ncbi:hypothetical protein [Halostagnicola sp. A-GB9-2]|uniref:hypothetical protein n=1 Tax=Halostagnicola sp. A-GB9-2 TaxID=3048066 RepID=UPI0024BFDF27|nr:hypothetical protein [Halostagnicola sp. A-GB9-2]MDJ1432461.1 hypothetical protein [Halostagnicola sp. A-GB9-2]